MPSSWTQNLYHAVFSTKHRLPTITQELEERLYPFIGGILKDLRCTPIAINGTADHLHFLARRVACLWVACLSLWTATVLIVKGCGWD